MSKIYRVNRAGGWELISAAEASEISAGWIMQIFEGNIYLMDTYEPKWCSAKKKWWQIWR